MTSLNTRDGNGYTIRTYQPADLPAVKQLFADNIREEWRDTYHEGKYAENAERYIESVCDNKDSDLNTIEDTYFGDTGGCFWVLTHCEEGKEKETVVGTCGCQRLSDTTAEVRRMCLAKDHRRLGYGTKMLQVLVQHARTSMSQETKLSKLLVSTIEHSVDGIKFYKERNGFVDVMDESTGGVKKSPVHGTPICEVFMEYHL